MSIFKKSDDDATADKVPSMIRQARPTGYKNISVVESTRLRKGKLSAADGLIIEGHLECTMAHHEKLVTVGEYGQVKADLHASTVIVLGQLTGNIYSEGMVSLARGSDVTGNIFCACVVIEDGARFKGGIDMEVLPNVEVVPAESMAFEPLRRKKSRPNIAKPGLYA